jgi:hypothetical protein
VRTAARPALFAVILGSLAMVRAAAQTPTATTTLNVTVGPEASLTVSNGTNLTHTGNSFAAYTGVSSLTYRIRTVTSGTITMKVTGDFSPAGGPSVASPPTAGDALTCGCSVSGPAVNGSASGCAAGTQASVTSASTVATFSADARSSSAGDTATVTWNLTDDPAYKSGSYSATVTFTISAN